MKVSDQIEIEVRFLEVSVQKLLDALQKNRATDLGEDIFQEIIFYDAAGKWQSQRKFCRLRKTSKGTFLAFKHNKQDTVDGTVEIETKVADFKAGKEILENCGLVAFREQEKKRHSFQINNVIVDIDTWPKIPTYVELEGPSEQALRDAAKKLELNWENAIFEPPRYIIEKRYGIPVSTLHYFTFSKIE